ncbi:helix-turn-helix domain-containing protein [Zhenhengia yiwuensis]|uniref:Helix-turn-helix domain-containing protein n=1 Tax=Zhenhengia yiwuensis TaxID=2763666 RepID=A0A926EGX4_9FIRM|nr:helix-turn-helix transcriptional regulator [Zhenhengia yiwuensis]MBC8580946.1 helix-turn-helix domain-containing protein [Zhenhengia yiwuensis]MBS5799091.1 helix-turn-helix domain-containing protein [Clostridiales bacterium]
MNELLNEIKPLNIPTRIKALRKAKGLTQKELAKQAGVSFSMVSKIESGERNNPSLEILEKIGNVIDLTLDDLLGNNSLHNQIIAEDIAFLTEFFKSCSSEESNLVLDIIDSICLLLRSYPTRYEDLEHLKLCSMYIGMIRALSTHLENVCFESLLLPDEDMTKKLFSTYTKEKELINSILDSIFENYLDKLVANKSTQTSKDYIKPSSEDPVIT